MNDTRPLAPWWALYALAGAAMAIFAGALVAAYAARETQLANNLSIGALSAMTGALGYFFGSSAGSQKKDDTIAANAAALASSTPTVPAAAPNPNPNPQP